jgi:hypothetical protein
LSQERDLRFEAHVGTDNAGRCTSLFYLASMTYVSVNPLTSAMTAVHGRPDSGKLYLCYPVLMHYAPEAGVTS